MKEPRGGKRAAKEDELAMARSSLRAMPAERRRTAGRKRASGAKDKSVRGLPDGARELSSFLRAFLSPRLSLFFLRTCSLSPTEPRLRKLPSVGAKLFVTPLTLGSGGKFR